MNIIRRGVLYVLGLFFLSLGVSLSIQAGLGVSPVSSLAYAISLTTSISIGLTTVLSNVLFIGIQVLLNKRMELKQFVYQLLISFLFGFFMDITLRAVQIFPAPESIFARTVLLIVSFGIVSVGLFGYFTAKLPLMPVDALTYVIYEKFKLAFGKAKMLSDGMIVCAAVAICLIFIHSFGSIGIGTLAAAYFIGKLLGWIMTRYQQPLQQWMLKT